MNTIQPPKPLIQMDSNEMWMWKKTAFVFDLTAVATSLTAIEDRLWAVELDLNEMHLHCTATLKRQDGLTLRVDGDYKYHHQPWHVEVLGIYVPETDSTYPVWTMPSLVYSVPDITQADVSAEDVAKFIVGAILPSLHQVERTKWIIEVALKMNVGSPAQAYAYQSTSHPEKISSRGVDIEADLGAKLFNLSAVRLTESQLFKILDIIHPAPVEY